jgi:MoxR-like ATPase
MSKNDNPIGIGTVEANLEAKAERLMANSTVWKPTPFLSKGRATQQLVTVLNAAYRGGRKPVILRGKPGGGKTEFVKAWAAKHGYYVEFLNLSQMDPTDLQGHLTVVTDPDRKLTDPETGAEVIVPGETYTKYTKPEYARRIDEALASGKYKGIILFLDEYSNAAPSMKAASLTLVQNKRINNLVLDDSVMIVAAMNEVADAEDGYTLGAPSANRLLHINFSTEYDDWKEGFLLAFNQRQLSPEETTQRFLMAKFLDDSNSYWYDKPKSDEKAGQAWPSPRSWDNAAEVCAYLMDDPEAHLLALDGYVGKEAAAEYTRIIRALALPTYESVMANPEATPWRTLTPDALYYVLQNVAARLSGENLSKTGKVFIAAADAGVTDVTSALVDDVCKRAAALARRARSSAVSSSTC